MGKPEVTPAHEFAELFPLHDGPPLWELSDDIKENGQLEPIILFEEKIVDGRRRELGCFRAGVKPTYKQFKGTRDEALTFVISKNLHRRNLTVAERAFIANKVATMERGRKSNTSNDVFKSPSQQDAADKMGVGVATVQRAKQVEKNGSPELIEAAKSGTISLGDAAAIVDKPSEVQTAAVEAVKAGKAKTVKAAVKQIESAESKVLDEQSHEVPAKLIPVFNSLQKFQELDTLARQMQKGLDELSRLPGGEQIRMQLQPTGSINKSPELNAIKSHLKFTRPHSVCPWCCGKGNCSACNGVGWVSQLTWKIAADDVKARLACV